MEDGNTRLSIQLLVIVWILKLQRKSIKTGKAMTWQCYNVKHHKFIFEAER